MNIKFLVLIMSVVTAMSFVTIQFFLEDQTPKIFLPKDEIQKTKLDIDSLFDIYGYKENFEIKDGKKIWYDPKFELNPENNEIYSKLNYSSKENTVVIYPVFTASAYDEPGFYAFFRDECGKDCLTVTIDDEYSLDFTASGNGF